MRKGQDRKVKVAGGASCLGLLALGMALVNPMSCLSAFAEGEDSGEAGVPAIQSSVPSSVQIAFGEPVGVSSLTPIDANGASALYSVKATVNVSNSGGYTVYLGSSKAELTGKNSGATINGVTSSTNYEGMPVNSWGYSYVEGEDAGTTFSAMPANVRGVTLGGNNSTNIKTDTKTFTLSFAAHIGNDKPADTYENEVTMSVVSSPLEVTNDFGITTMQEMTAKICTDASDIDQDGQISAQLEDVRDGKYYWVSKLADGKCWMTQNLDLDLDADTLPLTPATSDVASDWVPKNGTTALYTATTASSSTVLVDNTGQMSWSLGNYRIINPNTSSDCGSSKNSAANCTSQFIAYETPTSADKNELAHYILGNHYQWNAATAGTGGSNVTSGQAASSVCPKGWRLPTGNTSGEFVTLVAALGGTSSTNNVTKAPFYGVRGGDVGQNTSTLLFNAGNRGAYWSSTPYSNASNAYNLDISGTSSVAPSSNLFRYDGNSVRCIAR